MTTLQGLLKHAVNEGTVPGAVALVARGGAIEVAAAGSLDTEGSAPMTRDTIVRIASITKPITAAVVMMLVEEGRIALDDPISRWLPELAAPTVVRTPESPVDDVVPAARPITVFDLLTFTAGYGFASDFSLPAVQGLFGLAPAGGDLQKPFSPDEWLARLADMPMLYQPGEAFLYDLPADLQGVLIVRVTGQPLEEVYAERVFAPLGMVDTGFMVPVSKRDRFASYYRIGQDGSLVLADAPDGPWSKPPVFASGGGGLVSTVDDWTRFGRMLLDKGTANGRRLLSPDPVRQMMTAHLTPAQREVGRLFLEGQSWGFGGSVDIDRSEHWNEPGRYGWVGGTGTTAHVIPSTGAVAILLTQVGLTSPEAPAIMRDFWRCAAMA